MIIWINGAYGCGKSTVAEALERLLPSARIFDAEEVGNAVRNSYPDCPYGYIFEDYPLWSEFCVKLLADLQDNFSETVLVPMTLLRRKSYENIILKLKSAGYDIRLVVLEATSQTIHDRILSRGEEEGCWCMENIELSSDGSRSMDGLHIVTDGSTPKEIAEQILNFI